MAWMEQVIITIVLPSLARRSGFGGRGLARIGKALLDVAVVVEVFDIGRRGNNRGDLRAAFHGLAEFAEFDFIARFFQGLKIRNDFGPIEEFVVDADFVAEVGFGRGHGSEGGGRYGEGDQYAFHSSYIMLDWRMRREKGTGFHAKTQRARKGRFP